MKHTEQRWMHISTGLLVERGRKPDNSANDYRIVTVTWDEPEYEDVEVVRWECKRCKAIQRDTFVGACPSLGCACEDFIELKGVDRRRKPEPEPQVWEGKVRASGFTDDYGFVELPKVFIGKRVGVRVLP